jgi:hypothetical protein
MLDVAPVKRVHLLIKLTVVLGGGKLRPRGSYCVGNLGTTEAEDRIEAFSAGQNKTQRSAEVSVAALEDREAVVSRIQLGDFGRKRMQGQ